MGQVEEKDEFAEELQLCWKRKYTQKQKYTQDESGPPKNKYLKQKKQIYICK